MVTIRIINQLRSLLTTGEGVRGLTTGEGVSTGSAVPVIFDETSQLMDGINNDFTMSGQPIKERKYVHINYTHCTCFEHACKVVY